MRKFSVAIHPAAVGVRALMLASLFACSGTPTSDSVHLAGRVNLAIDNAGSALVLAPKTATLVYGTGIFLRAQVVDANGAQVPGAKATWRSTNPGVALVNPMADSTGVAAEYGRVAIASISPGTALIIASYEDVADTATITITPRVDSVPTVPPVTDRAKEADLTFRVSGVNSAFPVTDSINRYPKLAGAKVTLTLLPLQAGDTVATGTTIITAPTVVGTLTTDANASVTFPKVPITRYRVDIEAPAGTNYAPGTLFSGALYYGNTVRYVMLYPPE